MLYALALGLCLQYPDEVSAGHWKQHRQIRCRKRLIKSFNINSKCDAGSSRTVTRRYIADYVSKANRTKASTGADLVGPPPFSLFAGFFIEHAFIRDK